MKPNKAIAKQLARTVSLLTLSLTALLAHAEYVVVWGTLDLPPEIATIRARQQQLSEEENFSVRVADRSLISGTMFSTVPEGLKSFVIKGPGDLLPLIDRLYDYYGKLGDESLVVGEHYGPAFAGGIQYTLIEYIGEIETPSNIYVLADKDTGEIKKIDGWFHLDRGYERVPGMPKEEAIKNAVDFVRDRALYSSYAVPAPTYEGNHDARVVYSRWGDSANDTFMPIWLVQLDSPVGGEPRPSFYVRPDGRVQSTEITVQ
jgi:hypothetical protein